MNRWRQIAHRLLYPHAVLVLLLTIGFAGALVAVFWMGWEEHPLSALVYAGSAYTLTVAILRLIPLCKVIRRWLRGNALYHRYRTDLKFKAEVSIRLSLVVTVFYAMTKAAAGVWYRSAWFGSLAAYYLILAAVRWLLICHVRGNALRTYRTYRSCGCLLLVLTLALGAMSFYTIYENKVFEYPWFMIYAAAGFTFYQLILSIVNLFRYKKLNDPIYTAGKIFALASALVSLFFLQTSMFFVFGDGGSWQHIMNLTTGGCVFALIVLAAVGMIRQGTRRLTEHKNTIQ